MGKRVLISGYIGFQNFGDDAILGLLVRYLRKSNCAITALSSDPESTEKMFKIKALNYMNFFHILWGVFDTNVLISGGGSLIQNGTSSLSLLYYLAIIFLAKLFGKKVIIFAQGIGPIYGKGYQWLSKKILKMCDLILVRDGEYIQDTSQILFGILNARRLNLWAMSAYNLETTDSCIRLF